MTLSDCSREAVARGYISSASGGAPQRRDEHTTRVKDKDEREPSQKGDGDEIVCAGNRRNFGLIDARYDGVVHDDFAFFS